MADKYLVMEYICISYSFILNNRVFFGLYNRGVLRHTFPTSKIYRTLPTPKREREKEREKERETNCDWFIKRRQNRAGENWMGRIQTFLYANTNELLLQHQNVNTGCNASKSPLKKRSPCLV